MHQLTLSFATLAELQAAVAKLSGSTSTAGKSSTNAPKEDAASSSRTAEAGKADAPEKKDAPSDPFDEADSAPVTWEAFLDKLKAYSKTADGNKAFPGLMKKWGVEKVPALKDKGEAFWRDTLKELGL